MNPKKSANFAKVLGNRSKTDVVDAKMLSTFHALLTEEDFGVPEVDEMAEQLGAELGSYEMIQKTRTMLSNHLQSLEYKSGVTRKLKDSLERELGHLGTMEDQLEKEMEAVAEDHEETFTIFFPSRGSGSSLPSIFCISSESILVRIEMRSPHLRDWTRYEDNQDLR